MSRAPSKMRTLLNLFAVAGLIAFATGCATRTVVIDSGTDVVRLGDNVKGTVYVYDRDTKAWVKTRGKMHLPEGWFAGPPPP